MESAAKRSRTLGSSRWSKPGRCLTVDWKGADEGSAINEY